jgi:cyclohexanecarboxyl-CoA dehydrogenase
MGYFGIQAPERYGGNPLDWVSTGLVMEEFARFDVAASVLLHHAVASIHLITRGSEELQEEWIPPLVRGEKIGAFLITEPECGSDSAAIKTRAVRDGDTYIINGEKTSITYGTQADVGILVAKTDPAKGARGITAFLVTPHLPGIGISLFQDMGWKPMERCSFFFDGVRIPAKNRIGQEGEGFTTVMQGFDFLRVLLSLEVLGMARTALEMAMDYAKQRIAFGRPIAKFEGISFKIAEAATYLDAARMLCYRALWLRDQGRQHTKESAMCKWFCPQVAVRIIHDSLLIHGHFGYAEDYPIQQYLRDAIGFELADGSAEIMKVIIARELLGREFLPY